MRPGTADFFVFDEIFIKDTYKLSYLSIEHGGTIIDIGANVGYFTCAVLNNVNKVISVEPVSENYRQAVRNISLNGGNPQNTLNCAVVGQETGEKIKIFVDANDKGRSSVSDIAIKALDGEELVNTISLSKIFADYNLLSVDLVKIDVEGAEYEIFMNTPLDILKRINKIVMEIHKNERWPINYAEDLIKYFKSAGFKVDCNITNNAIKKKKYYATILLATRENNQ